MLTATECTSSSPQLFGEKYGLYTSSGLECRSAVEIPCRAAFSANLLM
jgi:hypothetical protein